MGHTDVGADRATFLKLYRTVVRSKLDFGSFVNGSAKTHVESPGHYSSSGPLIAIGASRTSPIKSLYAEAVEPSLEHQRTKSA
ncbi:hypothetical protein PoB_005097100 [Plakobranchus ocellatus]|uniref:Uncharacterized protein n=1 Tax=Plakobranchus ocellatus TaxID=259542 RepID=A0AAV4BZB3_9GAST|nr:hypothetical protein PoB_005097100 [Plakobranchus ocellatus]